jgi:hypothetical protein
MNNKAMQRKLKTEEAVDVRMIGTYIPRNEAVFDSNVFELTEFDKDDKLDYCDAQTEGWIWSIGKRRSDGKVFAAFDGRYYLHPDYECVWLR